MAASLWKTVISDALPASNVKGNTVVEPLPVNGPLKAVVTDTVIPHR